MKKYFLIMLLIVANYLVSGQVYDTAIAVLQPLTMSVHNGFGTAQTNYWIQDSTGFVQDSVTFPSTRNYRFDFTGHAPTYGAGLHPNITIRIDGVLKATVNVSKTVDSIWSSLFNVSVGKHAVRIAYTDPTVAGTNKVFMGLLYISSSNTATPVKYPTITKDALPAYGTSFLSSSNFASGMLRGLNENRNPRPTDVPLMASYGANLLRIYVEILSNGTTYSFISGELDSADGVLQQAALHNMYVNIVLTEGPSNDLESFWGVQSLKNSYINRMSDLATRYKNNKSLAAISLCNEPNIIGNLGEWCYFAQQLSSAIKRVDTNHVIVMPSGVGVQDIFRFTEPLPYSDVIYEYHSYSPFEITHQGINAADSIRTNYPNASTNPFYNSVLGTYGKTQVSALLQLQRDYSKRWNVPIYIGEFSCIDWAPNYSSARYISDAIDLFEAEDWSGAYHALRQYEGWEAEIPSGRWYGFTFTNANPNVTGGDQTLDQYRTDTTLSMIRLKQWFLLDNVNAVSFQSSTYSTSESPGRRIKIIVSLSAISATDVSVTINTANGTAIAGTDYTAITNKVLVLPAGTTARSFCVSITSDAITEASESFTVSLSNAINAAIGTGTATVTIN